MRSRHMGQLYLTFFLLLFHAGLWASNPIDSLKTSLQQNALEPQARVLILNDLAERLRRVAPVESRSYAEEAMVLVKSHGLTKAKAKTLENLAYAYLIQGSLDTALLHINQSISLADELGQEFVLADSYHIKGLIYQLMGDYSDALINYHEALFLNEKFQRERSLVTQLNNMAMVRRELKDYELAIQLLQKQRSIAERINYEAIIMTCDGNLAYVYLDLEQFDKALPHIQASTQRAHELGDSMSIAVAKYLLAECHLGLGDIELSYQYAREALLMTEAIGYRDGIVYAKYLIAAYHFYKKDYNEAIFFAKEAVDLTGGITNRNLDRLLTIMVNSYKGLGQQPQAYKYQDELLRVKEANFNKDSDNLTFRLEADALLREKEKEKERLEREILVGQQLISSQRTLNILAFCLAALVIAICLLLYRSLLRRNRQKTMLEQAVTERTLELQIRNEELQQSNTELENFAYIVSHDLKEPLRNINSFTNLAQRSIKKNDLKATMEFLDYVINSTFQINTLIEGILRYSLLWQEQASEMVDLNEVIEELKEKMKSSLEDKNVQLTVQDLPVVEANATEMALLFGNLMENGVKYNESEVPTIEIAYLGGEDHYEFCVSDNGIGIQKTYHDTIFKMFKRLHHFSKYHGTGLGLAIVKRIIEKRNGNIWVESQPNHGTTFYFSLPKSKET